MQHTDGGVKEGIMDNSVTLTMSREYAFELKKTLEKVLDYDEKAGFLPSEDFDTLHNLFEAVQLKLGVEL